jgi:hypothetical protein
MDDPQTVPYVSGFSRTCTDRYGAYGHSYREVIAT